MSRQVRQRLTAVLLGALLLGAPLLANRLANAGDARPMAPRQSHPALVTVTSSRPPDPISAIASHGSAVPDPGTRPRISIKTTGSHRKHTPLPASPQTKIRWGTHSSAPMAAGKPPRIKKAGARRVPMLDLPSPAMSAPAAPAWPGPEVAADRVAATEPMSQNGLLGLLAAVSIVLVLGVSAGVIRAIVSERASRTKIA